MMKFAELQRKMPALELRLEEPMERHTSFRIGGPAEAMAFPKTVEELGELLKMADLLDISWRILGAGTNVLAPDEGISGLTVCLKDCLGGMERLDDTHIRIMAGVTMSRAAVYAAGLGLSGLEFAHGIPGTVGGGVYMNAGAYGGEIAGVCVGAGIMRPDGQACAVSGQELGFSYRHSVLEESRDVVLWADFALEQRPAAEIREKMQQLQAKRRASQPLDLPSAGSAFKRPVGGYAAALIQQAGLKGYRVGNAAISEKHAGFAVNLGGATAAEVRRLLREVSDGVFAFSGIRLEPEVRIWQEERYE